MRTRHSRVRCATVKATTPGHNPPESNGGKKGGQQVEEFLHRAARSES